jgi:5-formyltetrahydrofolate cyclo-ligase
MSAEAVTQQKQELRKKVLATRATGHDCGHAHSQLLIDYSWEKRVKTVACYISFGDEPSTNVFLKHCQFNDRISLYVPRVTGDNLEWVLFNEDQARHPLGMNEPLGDAVELTEVDLMVVPALAIDRTGARLGRGRGYYDRTLAKLEVKTLVGLIHDDELVDSVPTEGHDAKVQAICTCSAIVTV